jgi:mutator protein MutT
MKNLFMLPAYVGIILEKDNEVFLVQRNHTDWASGQWNFPGGLLEEDETLVQAVVREAQEEVGVVLDPAALELVHVLQVKKSATNTKDILGFYFAARSWHGVPVNNESHRHAQAGWFSIDALPEFTTEHAKQALQGVVAGIRYSEN